MENINALQFEIDALKAKIQVLEHSQESLYSEVNRVEVIQHSPPYNGRAYTNYNAKEVEIQLQDNGKTLKLFLK